MRLPWQPKPKDDDDYYNDVEESRPPIKKPQPQLTEYETCSGCEKPMIFSHDAYEKILNETFSKVKYLGKSKGREYSGDEDRLANFRRNGDKLRVPKEMVWAVYASKHYDAIIQRCQDIVSGRDRQVSESIDGRVDDLILYLILYKCMEKERRDAERSHKHHSKPKPKTNGTHPTPTYTKAKPKGKLPG